MGRKSRIPLIMLSLAFFVFMRELPCIQPTIVCLVLAGVDSHRALNVKLLKSFKNYGKTKIQSLIEA